MSRTHTEPVPSTSKELVSRAHRSCKSLVPEKIPTAPPSSLGTSALSDDVFLETISLHQTPPTVHHRTTAWCQSTSHPQPHPADKFCPETETRLQAHLRSRSLLWFYPMPFILHQFRRFRQDPRAGGHFWTGFPELMESIQTCPNCVNIQFAD